MNKTVNINLGGIFFHIDEVAYQKLKRYIDAIRRSLSDDPKGRDEIISDIELRIGELLSERVKDVRQVVSEADIEEVIGVMGQPEDYLVDEELFTEETKRSYSRSTRREKTSGKKLFRDGDDKFLGGVASGIAYYFDVDVIWVRIAILVTVFAGFGSGLLIYIIMWILLPEAKTTTDKLQMEGEPVNISNIEKRVRAEFEDASNMVRDAANEVSTKVKEGMGNVSDSLKKKRVSSNTTKSGIQEFIEVIGGIIVTFFKIIGKFIGIILVLAAVVSLIALIISLFTAGAVDFMGIEGVFDEDFYVMNPLGISGWLISLLALVLGGIPLLMLFFLGLFIISGDSKTISRTGKFVLLGVWLIALLSTIYIGLRQGAEFAREGTVREMKDINLTDIDTLSIKMIDDNNFSRSETMHSKFGFRYVYDENDERKFYFTDVRFEVRVSDSTETYVKIRKRGQGRNRNKAKENAKRIDYDFKLTGNKLLLNNYFLTDSKFSFIDKKLEVIIYVPKDKVVQFDESTKNFISYKMRTTNNMYNRNMADQQFLMTDEGLKCLDCSESESKESENEWKYEDNSSVNEDDDKKEDETNREDEKREEVINEKDSISTVEKDSVSTEVTDNYILMKRIKK